MFLLRNASAELQSDRDVVLEAVKGDGSALIFAANHLGYDRDVVLEAVKSDGHALLFALADLRSDREFVCNRTAALCSMHRRSSEGTESSGLKQ